MSARAPVRLSSAQTFAPRIDKKLLHFLESIPDAIILSDQKGRIVLANANAEQMFGYSREELAGKEIEILVPERFRARHRGDRVAYYANPVGRRMGLGRDLCACNKDGIEFPVEINLGPVEIRGKTLFWSAIRDIGDRERSIAQIREAMRKSRFVLGGMISICAWCKRVRDEGGWLPLEQYVASHSEVKFTHGVCKDCFGTLDDGGHKHEAASHKPRRRRGPQEGGSSMPKTLQNGLYMVVERFKDATQVYQRLWENGRILPNGLVLVSAWFDENVERSYRLMQTQDRRQLDEWMANWDDLIDFEVYPVITPEKAGEKVAARMRSSTSQRSAQPV
jgi:PAS domain S-box-containing protein